MEFVVVDGRKIFVLADLFLYFLTAIHYLNKFFFGGFKLDIANETKEDFKSVKSVAIIVELRIEKDFFVIIELLEFFFKWLLRGIL